MYYAKQYTDETSFTTLKLFANYIKQIVEEFDL